MELLRIEKDGQGPYRNEGRELIQQWADEEDFDLCGPRHPNPSCDSKLCNAIVEARILFEWGEFLFGFENEQALRSWFYADEIIRQLHEVGYVLNTYTGTIFHGNTQSVILKETETLKETRSLLTLLG